MPGRGGRWSQDSEVRALVAGSVAAPALLLLGLVIGQLEGGLLPGDCQGLACLFNALVFGGAGVLTVVWGVLWTATHLARRRWPDVAWRLWALRIVATASWVPVVWLVVLGIDG